MNKKPIQVLFLLPTLSSGGAERVLITYMNTLDKIRFKSNFLSINNQGDLHDLIDPTIGTESLNVKRVMLSLPALYLYLKREKPDVVVTTMAYMNFILLLLKPLFRQTVFIVREANRPTAVLEHNKHLKFVFRLFYKFLYPMANSVIVPAECLSKELSVDLNVDTRNNITIYNPVNVELIEEKLRSGLTPNEKHGEQIKFVASGRLHAQKGFDRLIEGLGATSLPYNWRLDILGSGGEKSRLEMLILKHKLQEKVRLIGFVKNPWPHYAAADAFLLPSRSEGLPNAALESLVCGTPIIGHSEAGGIKEIASAAEDGAVTVLENMNDFVSELKSFSISSVSQKKASMLPRIFQQAYAVEQLENLILEKMG